MTAIRYQPGASYEEQLRIWANGNEDEHRLAVFLEAASDDIRQQGHDDGYSEGYSDGYSEGYAEGRSG